MLDVQLWLKATHIVAMVAWMAGLLYLPRLFVYHSETAVGSAVSETFKTMEQRLVVIIMRPAMAVTIAVGLLLMFESKSYSLLSPWLSVKLVLVAGLLALHGMFEWHAVRFQKDERVHTSRFYRVINEIPALLMIGIVFLVVLKPPLWQ